jgi:hypothetical protein
MNDNFDDDIGDEDQNIFLFILKKIMSFVIFLVTIPFLLFSLYCTLLAFIGGTIPIINLRLSGDLLTGIIFILFVDPIIVGLSYPVAIVISLPICGLFFLITYIITKLRK